MRHLSLLTFIGVALFAVACSDNTGNNNNGGGGGGLPDLATGMTGGDDGGGGDGGMIITHGDGMTSDKDGPSSMADMTQQTGTPDMASGYPDPNTLPKPTHSPTQHGTFPTFDAPSTNVITNPEVWTIIWQGSEALGAQVDTFTQWMLTSGSTYWGTATGEYTVGAGKSMGVIVIKSAPPATIQQTSLPGLIKIGSAGWPTQAQVNANTIFSLIIPKTTKVMNGGTQGNCTQYGGYHTNAQTGEPFLVNAVCDMGLTDPTAEAQAEFDDLTVTISHEAGEASTDVSHGNNAFNEWTDIGGAEDGDLCLGVNMQIKSPAGTTYTVQRLYSNANAMAPDSGMDICLPSNGSFFGVYFPDVTVTIGSSTPFNISPFSYAPDVGVIKFYITSLSPKGLTYMPDYNRRRDPANPNNRLGMFAYGLAGSDIPVTVTAPAGTTPGSATTLILAATQAGGRFAFWGHINVQ